MTAHMLVVCLSVALAISLGVIAVLIVLLWRCVDALRRMGSVLRKCRRFYVGRMANSRKNYAELEEAFKSCLHERSLFLAKWKLFAPKAKVLGVLCEYWEAETYFWRKKCWWMSDKTARERDRNVIHTVVESVGIPAFTALFTD